MSNLTNLILENEGLIYKIISKYQNYFELDDLYQEAVKGLIKASNNYKSEYNTKFTSYAYPYILGEVIKYINEYRSIKVSKNSRTLYYKIMKTKEILSQKLMKTPTTYELSLFLEIDENIIEDVLLSNMTVDSLDKIVSKDSKDFELYDKCGYSDTQIDYYPLLSAIENLPLEEQKIIKARYYEDMSQKEVGEVLGMYQVEVSRKEKKILAKLKDKIIA